MRAQGRAGANRSGATLVEVMVASVILAVLALSVAASIHYARSTSILQRNRRTAMEAANGRMEDVRSALFSEVRPANSNYNVYYLNRTSANWAVTSADPGENIVLNGRTRSMVTTVQYMDADGGSASYDCLRVLVSVQYNQDADSKVILETLKAP